MQLTMYNYNSKKELYNGESFAQMTKFLCSELFDNDSLILRTKLFDILYWLLYMPEDCSFSTWVHPIDNAISLEYSAS